MDATFFIKNKFFIFIYYTILSLIKKAEFGFFGVVVKKLTKKLPLMLLYKTVHEIFISYGFSFKFLLNKKKEFINV